MNNELKKIIKEIECYQNEDMCMIMLSQKENKALLDYITNLQQENNNLKTSLDESQEVVNDLQQRIEKAVEYIKVECMCNYGLDDTYMEKLLNILNGKEGD